MSFTLFTTASGFQVSSNNNNDLYKAAIHSAGEHLNTSVSLTPIDFIIIASSLVIKMLFISINKSEAVIRN